MARSLADRRFRRLARITRDPTAVQAAYSGALIRVLVGPMRKAVAQIVLPELQALHAAVDGQHADSAVPKVLIDRIVHRLRVSFGEVADGPRVAEVAAAAALEADRWNARAQQKLIDAALAERKVVGTVPELNIFADNPFLSSARDQFVQRNVALVKNMAEQQAGRIGSIVTEGVQSGLRPADIAKQLQEDLGIAESRARLIARDQVTKFNGELASVRQQSLGVTHFTWSTSHDERVRKSHQALDGQEFAWSNLPMVDGEQAAPGQPIQCRCNAIPVL